MPSRLSSSCLVLALYAGTAPAAVLQYGDKDILGFGSYPTDPVTGATLEGLAPGVTSVGTYGLGGYGHSFPFSPEADDYAGTDQIYVGSVQTGNEDGYSNFAGRLSGPQVIMLDYGTLIGPGERVATLTLGIAFDDFQFPNFGEPYSVSVNGLADGALTALANSFNQTGPRVSFGTIGIDPGILTPDHLLVLAIDQGGNGGDGWAVDFLTVGVTTTPVPVPGALLLAASGLAGLLRRRRHHG
ncbi:MAG: hypothetical protein RLW61_18510 [Gammaproteobacteria bacterium]